MPSSSKSQIRLRFIYYTHRVRRNKSEERAHNTQTLHGSRTVVRLPSVVCQISAKQIRLRCDLEGFVHQFILETHLYKRIPIHNHCSCRNESAKRNQTEQDTGRGVFLRFISLFSLFWTIAKRDVVNCSRGAFLFIRH
jgi:hypothetical protein